MPECVDDFRAWEPKDYREHFAASRFSNRDAIIAAYESADPELSRALDMPAELLNTTAVAHARAHAPAHRHAEVERSRAAPWTVRPLIARTAALINGTAPGLSNRDSVPQAAIDAMFRR